MVQGMHCHLTGQIDWSPGISDSNHYGIFLTISCFLFKKCIMDITIFTPVEIVYDPPAWQAWHCFIRHIMRGDLAKID
jgi:hypothetical protein